MIMMPSKNIKLVVGIVTIFFVLGYNNNLSFTVASPTSDSSEGEDIFGTIQSL